jgi:hypothetical protein
LRKARVSFQQDLFCRTDEGKGAGAPEDLGPLFAARLLLRRGDARL